MPKEQPKSRTRTIDLLPDDILRLSRLKAHYQKGSRVDIAEVAVMRLALEDACIFHGLEQRKDVEPIGDGS